MSLDVYLTIPRDKAQNKPARGSGIFIRENGMNKEISRAEWDERYPNREPVVALFDDDESDTVEVYSYNITHNLGKMASHAGIYYHLWRPDEIGITKAHQLIQPLTIGLSILAEHKIFLAQFNPSNGWGSYEGLIDFVGSYRDACMSWPDADVRVSI